MKYLMMFFCALAVFGCGKKNVPMGGKPVAHWAAVLREPDANARKQAVRKLGNMGTAEAWPLVQGALQDGDPRVRAEAVQAVLKFGSTAAEASPKLAELQKSDQDAYVRSMAEQVLGKLHRDNAIATK